MRHASLFTGIGGFDLAAHWMGWQNVFQVEIDPWCQKLLTKRFPGTPKHTDIKAFDGTQYHASVDIISGGFPCQPYSAAGKRLGKEDERHLWPEMLRVIHEVQPSWVVGENVRGLTNWNGGMVFDEVQADLELAGYEVLPFLLPACGVNAPHRRDRIWFIAYANKHGRNGWATETRWDENSRGIFCTAERLKQSGVIANSESESGTARFVTKSSDEKQRQFRGSDSQNAVSDTNSQFGRPQAWQLPDQPQQRRHVQEVQGVVSERPAANHKGIRLQGSRASREQQPDTPSGTGLSGGYYQRPDWDEWPSVAPICRRNDGVPDRVDRLRALGNAIVPQVALQIFRAISYYENVH